jgi:sensor histidine kinase YesM
MIRDQLYKRLFIPLTAAAFPFLAGLFGLSGYKMLTVLFTILFFTGIVLVAWQGVVQLTAFLRTRKALLKNIFLKLVLVPVATGFLSATVIVLATLAWQLAVIDRIDVSTLLRGALVGGLGGLVLSLFYEIIYLSIEKEQDNRVLQQIERELVEAEVSVLKSELDPHFFFNCMNALSHLVRNDADKAWQFVHKLSGVYKYFLRNRDKSYVSLQDELEFLENYSFLLRIRFDDTIHIENSIDGDKEPVFILPCTLQVLVENAIKHNFFSEKDPLRVSIVQNGEYIIVSNPVKPKMHAVESTNVGLRNLKTRYRLLTNESILVQKTANKFLVKLPIVKTISHDKSSDH